MARPNYQFEKRQRDLKKKKKKEEKKLKKLNKSANPDEENTDTAEDGVEVEDSVEVENVLIALLICLIPTTIGGLLSAIGIAGMDRLIQRNGSSQCQAELLKQPGDVDVLMLDKTRHYHAGKSSGSSFYTGRRNDDARSRGSSSISIIGR